MRAFHADEMNPTEEICYDLEGSPFFAKTMAWRMRAFNINETVLHAHSRSYSIE